MTPFLRTALGYGLALTVVIAALGSLIGFLVAGTNGLVSGLLGAAVTALMMALTVLSITLAQRVTRDEPSLALFFGVILGVWLLKFVVFIIFIVLLRGAPFLDSMVFFVAVLAAVLGSLVVDTLAFVRTRDPYVDVELPGSDKP